MPRRTAGNTRTRQRPAPNRNSGPNLATISAILIILAILAAIGAFLIITPSSTTTTTTVTNNVTSTRQCSPPTTTILTGRCKNHTDAEKFCQHTMSCTVLDDDEKLITKWVDSRPEEPLVTGIAELETLARKNTWRDEEEEKED
ncbi:hypothetical protein AC578_7347 [Pseudocercospora eumusae]|uniref:Uncharacterized protein n=1 Tax=Pseudocercospora eumusae TaxID=321146 RepID=A0A139HWC4_9PEZI|nr:hypothetical protein AC578_7347 [Pseudocercospora eumusae]